MLKLCQHGNTAAIMAARAGVHRIGMVRYLVEHGADLHAKNKVRRKQQRDEGQCNDDPTYCARVCL